MEPLDAGNVLDVKAIYEAHRQHIFHDTFQYPEEMSTLLADNDATSVVVRFEGSVVGVYRFYEPERTARKVHSLKAGIAYSRSVWGDSRIQQVSEYLVDYLFCRVGVFRIEADTVRSNRPARSVMERLGFTLEGERRGARSVNNKPQTLVVYSLIRPDYFNRRN